MSDSSDYDSDADLYSDEELKADIKKVKSKFKDASADVDLSEEKDVLEPLNDDEKLNTDKFEKRYDGLRNYALKLRNIVEDNKKTVALAIKAAVEARLKERDLAMAKQEIRIKEQDFQSLRKQYLQQAGAVDEAKKEAAEWKQKYEEELEVEIELEETREAQKEMEEKYEELLAKERKALQEAQQLLEKQEKERDISKDLAEIASKAIRRGPSEDDLRELKDKNVELQTQLDALLEQQKEAEVRNRQRRESVMGVLKQVEQNIAPVNDIDEIEEESPDEKNDDNNDNNEKSASDVDSEPEISHVGVSRANKSHVRNTSRFNFQGLGISSSKNSAGTGVRDRLRNARENLRATQFALSEKRLLQNRLKASRVELRQVKLNMNDEIKSLRHILIETQTELASIRGQMKKRDKLVNDAQKLLASLKPWVGVEVPRTDEEDENVVKVINVRLSSPAETAGLKKGDIIETVDGEEITSSVALRETVRSVLPGDSLSFQVLRGGDVVNITIKVGCKGTNFSSIVELRRIANKVTKKGDETLIQMVKKDQSRKIKRVRRPKK